MLTKLSPEVLHLVARQLPGADLKSLSLVSHDIRRAVIRSLWSPITIHSSNETKLYDIITEGFLDPCIPHATQLRFAAPFQIGHYFRCPDRIGENTEENDFDNGNEEQEDDSAGETQGHEMTGPLAFERLSQRASSFMGKFKQDSLRSFRPFPFRNLKSICWKGPHNNSHRLLETVIKNNANHLSSLELDLPGWWKKTPPSPVYVEAPAGDDNSGYFGNTLKLHEHTTQPVFQNLTTLALVHAPLGPAMVDMIDFEVLRSLTLRLCLGWGAFTQRIVKMRFPIKLKALELHHDDSASFKHTRIEVDEQNPNVSRIIHEPKPGQSEVEEFIDVCEGLEELFLNLPKPDHARSLWKHIARHEASLKRLVVHHRTRYCNQSAEYWRKVDLPSLGLTEHGNENRPYHPPSQNPLGELKLECISLCCFPELAKFMLESSLSLPALGLPSLSLSSLKLIHIRQTGTDLQVFGSMAVDLGFRLDTYEANNRGEDYEYDFDIPNFKDFTRIEEPEPQTLDPREMQDTFRWLGEWAFGPGGPPMLEVVAYGDFAHEGRANPENLFLCSGPGGFRVVPRDGYEWMSIVDKYRNVLETCPTKPLLTWAHESLFDE
ncbi:Hypothetical protein NCS54_00513800 [Fusarium falciforme]|uniref:Hypothetical protein n=1 Tax=Fusarium falciforme TaxID=195108 RepID=UPI0023002822|nr:Hypothetical protein NCS54_00513800 [Fusarium falciforme]WAO87818.1 Hypothetical protein NCS54_00513800 [Fusarium falciforme]